MCDLPPCARRGCGHTWDHHQHHRAGTDCSGTTSLGGHCCCPGYQRPRLLDRVRDRLHVLWLRILG